MLIEYILFGLIYRETIYVCPSCIAMRYLNLSARTSSYIWLVLIKTVPSGVTVITSHCFKKLNILVETFVASTYLPLICHLILQEIHLLSLIIVIWHLVIHLVVLILKKILVFHVGRIIQIVLISVTSIRIVWVRVIFLQHLLIHNLFLLLH